MEQQNQPKVKIIRVIDNNIVLNRADHNKLEVVKEMKKLWNKDLNVPSCLIDMT